MSVVYTAPATCARFMQSDAFVRIIMGPVGSGKTTAAVMEILRRAIEQKRGPDGIRRTRWVITRQTLIQMRMTVLPDLLAWFRDFATYKVSDQLVTLMFLDVHCEIYLIPLEEEDDQRRLLSMNLTGVFVNECIEINPNFMSPIAGRVGRYPFKADGGPTWHGIIADTNCPIVGSEWWKLMEEDRPFDWQLFHQPSGLSIEAENVDNLPPGYYQRLAENPSRAWVQRYVLSEYGEDPSGTAVFRDSFKRSFHVVPELEPVSGYPIIVGQDFGRNPCSLICQPDHLGRLLVLEEVVGSEVGLETHVSRSLKPALSKDRYAGRLIACVGDPSGQAKDSILEENHFDALKRLGLPAFPAPTNNIDPRIAAVEALFYQQRDGGPAIVIDGGKCPMLVRALNGAYRFAKTKQGLTKPLPEKDHPWSDLADDLQYVSLVYSSGMVNYIARRIKPKTGQRRPAPSSLGWT
jgi:hypothetical protein